MENASKALIIAGAILLSILLISLGIMIFNQAQDTVNSSGMSEAEITAFNNKFLKYEGEQKASVVKALINEVIANNAEGTNIIKVKIGNAGSYTDAPTTSEITNKSYTVTLEYDDGRVYQIEIN